MDLPGLVLIKFSFSRYRILFNTLLAGAEG